MALANLLTEAACRDAKPAAKYYRLFDGNGLYLIVQPKGKKLWTYRCTLKGKEVSAKIGPYPALTLKVARTLAAGRRAAVDAGIDPRGERVILANTFDAVYAKWYAQLEASQQRTKQTDTPKKYEWIYRAHLLPFFEGRPIQTITERDILEAFDDTLKKATPAHDMIETTHRMRSILVRLFRWAKKREYVKENPATDLHAPGVLPPLKVTNHPGVTDDRRLGEVLRTIEHYRGQPPTIAALRLTPMVFVRPGELRAALWSEMDLDRAEWRIPGGRMKEEELHIVPLARQAVAILRELHRFTGHQKFVFPAVGKKDRPLSENTVGVALKAMGFSGDELVPHGFRTTASTMLNEQDVNADQIELQLSHKPGNSVNSNKVRAAYNKAQKLPARRKMMQEWADYLDTLKAAVQVMSAAG